MLKQEISTQQISCGKLEMEINAAYNSIDKEQTGKLLFAKESKIWKRDLQETKEIEQRLGWLTLPDNFTENVEMLTAFASQIKEEGYTHVVLLGMGGSSLCSEVARKTFGTTKGYLQLYVLDNTDPSAIVELENKINIDKTLFIAASKSGNTEETLSFFHYFYHQLENKEVKNIGNNFVAITDDGTPLVKIAKQYKFRKIFINPSDLGGRYSVLSDFGLVPMALMGINIHVFLSSAEQMEISCKNLPAATNPGISLGAALGICQKHGRDKVTFVLSSSINSFGYWAEQLLAESTGKEGRGLIPINGEELGMPKVYGADRIFIHIYLATDNNEVNNKKLKLLEEAGHPIVSINLANKLALGGEYYRWEIAVAIAGKIMGINPFNQPNVEESKKNTTQLLEDWIKDGSFKKSKPLLKVEDISIYGGKKNGLLSTEHHSVGEFLNSFIRTANQNDYIALLPYFLLTDSRTKILQHWRQQMRDELKVATTILGGPRYLHSTGQLHKGGPDTGLYIILIGDDEKEDLIIPEEKFGFATLHKAQALGDFRSLDDKGRRVIRINLGKYTDVGLDKLIQSINDISKQQVQQKTI